MAEFDYKEYARQMRGNCVKDHNGNIICSAELWEQIASIIETTADVVPKSEVDKLEYTLTGVMHSVDKWLDGEELEQDEVNRAITMREKTLRIIEDAKSDYEYLKKLLDDKCDCCIEEEKQRVARVASEIFEEIEQEILSAIDNNLQRMAEQEEANEIWRMCVSKKKHSLWHL